jgi:hypothetical protein
MLDKDNPNSFGLIVWVSVSCIIHIFLFKRNVNDEYQLVQRVLIGIIAVVFTIPTHELIHYLFAVMFGKGKARIEFAKDPLGFPSLRTLFSERIIKWKQVVVFLAPFVFLTLLFDIVFALSARINLFCFIVSISNSAGCYFDFIGIYGLLKC